MDQATYDLEKQRVEEFENKKRRLSTTKKWLDHLDNGAKLILTLSKEATITVHDGKSTQFYVNDYLDRGALRDYVMELLANEVGNLEEDLAAI